MDLAVHAATADRFEDVADVINPRRNAKHCWCLSYRLSAGEIAGDDDRAAQLRALTERPVAPGLLAYDDDKPVGWCGLGPRSGMSRLARSKTIQQVDDLPVWSVVCFAVRAGHRGKGVARVLLRGAIDYARDNGAPALEGYPVDPAGERINASFAYVGTTRMFEEAGFKRVALTQSHSARLPRWLMRLELR